MHKTLLRLWLIVWVITLPLVHIHPEADHAHGMSGHVHGGTYHSILVNTPVYAHQGHEHKEHHHDRFFSPGNQFAPAHSSSHPLHGFEEDAYGFSLLKPSLDLDSEQSKSSPVLVLVDPIQTIDLTGISKRYFSPKNKRSAFLPSNFSPRAPPVFFI